MTSVLSGLDRIALGESEVVRLVRGRKVGLLAHAASVDRQLTSALTVLERAGADVVTVFGPEHGVMGAAQDMVGVVGESSSGRPVYSLYGDTFEDLWPKDSWLRGLDAVIVDLQDVGTRYYTYVWTAAFMVQTAARLGVQTIVLDRPNPLGGAAVEGAPQRDGYTSFVGWHSVPVRHGMTIGELLSYVQQRDPRSDDAMSVVPMRGWRRSMRWDDTDLPWVMPSPNMPTLDTALVYPGGCLIEGTTLSEGRGTTRPFEIFGAPGIDTDRLVRETSIHGATLRPLSFEPTFQKHAGVTCAGVQLHINDHTAFRPYRAYKHLVAAMVSQLAPEDRWRTEPYEFVSDRPAIDLLTGGPEFRQRVDDANSRIENALADLDTHDEREAAAFVERALPHLRYPR